MNLRSVFTPEQQRVLERYYDNGMTNQSKGCFQLILQCAQETKLDFSVVRVRTLHVDVTSLTCFYSYCGCHGLNIFPLACFKLDLGSSPRS